MTFLSRLDNALCLQESNYQSKLLSQLDNICKQNDIPVCVIGGMAVAEHGYSRFTADIDLLISKENAHKLANELINIGWDNLGGNKLQYGDMIINLCVEGVKAGKTTFPAPSNNKPGIDVIDLPGLLVLKILANRAKDRGDFVELIKANKLNKNYIVANIIPKLKNPIDKKMAINLWEQATSEGP